MKTMDENQRRKVSDRIRVLATGRRGTVSRIGEDGTLSVAMDDTGGVECYAEAEVGPARHETELHDESGRFRRGHPKRGGVKSGYRRSRAVLAEQLMPFYENMGELIQSIPDQYNKVRAVALMSRFTLPTLASMDVKEGTQRNLSAEEQLVIINARFQGKPEPELSDEDEE
jgi:hypothetical protein